MKTLTDFVKLNNVLLIIMKLKLYSSTLLLMGLSSLVSAADPLIKNGNFEKKSLKPWRVFATEDQSKPQFNVASGVINITSLKVHPKMSNEQLSQQLEGLKPDTKYRLSFEAKSVDTKNQLLVTLARSKGWSKGHYGLFKKINLTKDWQKHTMNFKTKQFEAGNLPQMKFLFGLMEGKLSFKNVKLKEVKKEAKKEGKKEINIEIQ